MENETFTGHYFKKGTILLFQNIRDTQSKYGTVPLNPGRMVTLYMPHEVFSKKHISLYILYNENFKVVHWATEKEGAVIWFQ